MISGYRRDVDQICALLGYHTAFSGSYVQTFRDNLMGLVFKEDLLTLEDGTDRLFRNVGTKLPLNAV